MEDRSCPLCQGSLLSGELLFLEGTCSHRVCVDCLGTKDDERRKCGSAVGSEMPCPVSVCKEGRFDIERLPTYMGRIAEPVTSQGVVTTVTPQTKVKTERNDEDIDEEGQTYPAVYTKQETDDESSTASSRFSAISDDDEAPALVGQKADESPASDKLSAKPPEEVAVKEEPTIYDIQQRSAKHARIYGDRDLLARQSKEGMMKLGGGNVSTHCGQSQTRIE